MREHARTRTHTSSRPRALEIESEGGAERERERESHRDILSRQRNEGGELSAEINLYLTPLAPNTEDAS